MSDTPIPIRWCIIVRRADETVEILSELHHTEAEANKEAARCRHWYKGVEIKVGRCTIAEIPDA